MPAAAQDNAQLPYSMVDNYLDLFKSLEHLERIIPSMMISSTNPEIAPPAIEFKIKAADGWQIFNPDANGVISFPDRADWDGLVLISNQPKGTLQLVIGFSARPLSSTSMAYQELMGLVPQFEEAMAALAAMQGQPAAKIKGLTIQFAEGSDGGVTVLSGKGRKSLEPTSFGVVVIRYDDALWQENPPVEFKELPLGIVPLS